MKSLLKVVASATLLVSFAASAQAGSIAVGKREEISIDESKANDEKARLWKQFGGWCAISEWHPAIAKCEASKDGETQFRTLTLKDGGTIKEKLLEMTEGRYKYEIIDSPLPVKNYQAQFAITPDADDLDEMIVAWSATFDAKDKTDAEARAVIDGIFKAGLDNIKTLAGDKEEGDDDEKKDDKN